MIHIEIDGIKKNVDDQSILDAKLRLAISYITSRKVILTIVFGYLLLLMFNHFGFVSWLPGCPIKLLTGIECLGCGLNRASIAMLSLEFTRAWALNPLIYLYSLIFIIAIIIDFIKYSIKFKEKF